MSRTIIFDWIDFSQLASRPWPFHCRRGDQSQGASI